eukprot:m.235694 g.235694  ORF g.235694 m.235694 type:complete len:166 (-) comp26535_c0_seq12:12-509(-)
MSCTQRSPQWDDNFHVYTRRVFHKHMVLVIDIRGLDGNNFINQGWCVLPVVTSDGFVQHGRFQLPVFQGSVNNDLLQEMKRKEAAEVLSHALTIKKIKYVDGATLAVRVCDPRRQDELPRKVQRFRRKEGTIFVGSSSHTLRHTHIYNTLNTTHYIQKHLCTRAK